jgi:hypothetical protein
VGDFVTIDTLKSWLGMTSVIYLIVAVIKSMSPKKFSAWQLRGMAFLAGFIILLLVAVADAVFVAPWYAPSNFMAAGLLLINALGLVISTAGFHEIYKGPQGQTVPPLYPEEPVPVPITEPERAPQDEALKQVDVVQATITAEGSSTPPS